MSTELKRCPFCGGEAEVNRNMSGYYVQCMECETFIDTRGLRKDAVSFWNKRANDISHQNLPKAAKELIVKAWQDGAYIVGELSEKYSEKESVRLSALIAEIEAAAVENFSDFQFKNESDLFQNYVHKDAASDWAANRRKEVGK